MYSAKIIADSISETGKRLTTFEITFPRIVLAEFNTHRMFSRNSASSRAIPFATQIKRVMENPFVPERFPLNCKGMQPDAYISNDDSTEAITIRDAWYNARNNAVESAKYLYNCLGGFLNSEHRESKVHKQIVNRLLEPFMWHTVIVTATEFDNFFKLRTNEQAQWEIRRIADLMYRLYHNEHTDECHKTIRNGNANCNCNKLYITKQLKQGEWHLPYIYPEDLEILQQEKYDDADPFYYEKRISVARCARVSYLTHDGKRDIEKDLELFERLRTSGHWSPFEHVATPHILEGGKLASINSHIWEVLESNQTLDNSGNIKSGNFIGWKQFRKEFADENCTHFRKEN